MTTVNLLDKEQMLRKLRRMNQRAEQEREHNTYNMEHKVNELRDQISAATATMHRLREDKTSTDYLAAKDTRDTLTKQMNQLLAELNPLTEFERVNQQINQAKQEGKSNEISQVRTYMNTASKIQKKFHHTTTIYPHPEPWNGDQDAGNLIVREIHHLGESDPSLLNVPWTRFDYVPSIPWRDVRQGELTKHSGPGLLTYRTRKTDMLDARVTTSREGTSPIMNPGGITSRRSHRSTTINIANTPQANNTTTNMSEPLPSAFFNENSSDDNEPTGFDNQSDPPSFTNTATHQIPTLPLSTLSSLSSTSFNRTTKSKLPPVPSATIPRRPVMDLKIPTHLLDTLSPAQKRVPMHPAYQLDSVVHHPIPWRKPEKKPQLFSELPRNKAASSNDIARAKKFIVPDRVYYDPVNDGKVPWLKPEPNAIPIFSNLPLDAEWLSIFGTVEADELQQRFFHNTTTDNDQYEGEDAFNHNMNSTTHNTTMNGGLSSPNRNKADNKSTYSRGNTSTANSSPPRKGLGTANTMEHTGKMIMNTHQNSTMNRLSRLSGNTNTFNQQQTPLSPSLARRADYDQRKSELLQRHKLGIKAFEEAEKEAQKALVHVTSRMKGKDKHKHQV